VKKQSHKFERQKKEIKGGRGKCKNWCIL